MLVSFLDTAQAGMRAFSTQTPPSMLAASTAMMATAALQSGLLRLMNECHPYMCYSDQDVHRTGAKAVAGQAADPRGSGRDWHVTGVLRTKPGINQ